MSIRSTLRVLKSMGRTYPFKTRRPQRRYPLSLPNSRSSRSRSVLSRVTDAVIHAVSRGMRRITQPSRRISAVAFVPRQSTRLERAGQVVATGVQRFKTGVNKMVHEAQNPVQEIPLLKTKPFYVNNSVPKHVVTVGVHGSDRVDEGQIKQGFLCPEKVKQNGGLFIAPIGKEVISAGYGKTIFTVGIPREQTDSHIIFEKNTGHPVINDTKIYLMEACELSDEYLEARERNKNRTDSQAFKDGVRNQGVSIFRAAFNTRHLVTEGFRVTREYANMFSGLSD